MHSQYPDHPSGYPQPSRSNNYYSSIKGLAITCAIICTLLLGPLLGEATEDWITNQIISIYGYEWLDPGIFLWKALCWALVFFLTRAFVVAAIVAFGIGLAHRFPLLVM